MSLYDNGGPRDDSTGLPIVEAEAMPAYGLGEPLLPSVAGGRSDLALTQYDPCEVQYADSAKLRKRQAASICCCVCCAVFLLLFFLIPRKPYFASDYSSSVVSQSPFILSQTYDVYNPNPIPIQITSVSTQVTTQTSHEPYYFVTGNGAFPPGTDKVHIGSNSWKSIELYYNFTNTNNPRASVVANYQQCCTSSSVFTTTGSVDMSTSVSDYSDVSLGLFITVVECCSG